MKHQCLRFLILGGILLKEQFTDALLYSDDVSKDDWESTAVAKAEKTLRLLSEHCNFETLKCDSAPSDYKIVRLEQPEFFQLGNDSMQLSLANGENNSSDFPENWRDYLHPENLPLTSFVQVDQSGYSAHVCEGDMIAFSCNSSKNGVTAQDETNAKIQWSKATIPFVISPQITGDFRDIILEAMIMISQNTCVNFVQGNDVRRQDIVVFVPAVYQDFFSFGFATVGGLYKRKVVKVQNPTYRKGRIDMTLRGEILHLLMHVLGFGHEHNRPDRDQYLWINYPNIETGHENDFNIDNRTDQALIDGPYDYDSITHFGSVVFSKDPSVPILIPKEKGRRIGQRTALSSGDVYKINKLYRCGETAPEVSAATRAVNANQSRSTRDLHENEPVIEDTRVVPQRSPASIATKTPSFQPKCPVCVCPVFPAQSNNGTSTLNSVTAQQSDVGSEILRTPQNEASVGTSTGTLGPMNFDPAAYSQTMRNNDAMNGLIQQMVKGTLKNSGLGYFLNKNPLQDQRLS